MNPLDTIKGWWVWSQSRSKENELGLPIPNVAIVESGDRGLLIRGAHPETTKAYQALVALGVRNIVNLVDGPRGKRTMAVPMGVDARPEQTEQITVWHVPIADDETPHPLDVEEALALLANLLLRPIYIHCQGGRHRTTLLIACFLVRYRGLSKEEAWKVATKANGKTLGWYDAQGHKPLRVWFFEEFREK